MIKVLLLFVLSIFMTMSAYAEETILFEHIVPANKNVMIKTFYDNESFTGYYTTATQFIKKTGMTVTYFALVTNDIYQSVHNHKAVICEVFSRYRDDPATLMKAKLMQCNLQRTVPMNE